MDKEQDSSGKGADQSTRLTKRGWQMAILEQMVLPKNERSNDDRPVKASELKVVLLTIDNRAREAGTYYRDLEDFAEESQLSLRQLKRTLNVLERLGLVEKTTTKLSKGRRCHWKIIFQDLARLMSLPLWAETKCPPGQDQVPIPPVLSAHAGTTKSSAKEAPQEACLVKQPLDHKPSQEAWAERTFEFLNDLKLAYADESIDVRMVAQVAWLVEAGHDILAQVRDAIRGVTMTGQPLTKRMAYFRGCLNNKLGGKERVSRLLDDVAPSRGECEAVLPHRETLARDDSGELANAD